MQVSYTKEFKKSIKHLDPFLKLKVKKAVQAIVEQPYRGKPLQYTNNNERTVRVPPFRIIYNVHSDELTFLAFDHRKDIYDRLHEEEQLYS